MNCPHCKIELKISERKNIEIDYCPQCRGVWLDRGELDKLIEAPDRRYESRDQYNQNKGYYEKEDRTRHKRKSFLSEIFDF